jgi:flagellar hook-associated protein 2
MASPITFGGLASGLDTKSIIAALVAVEGRKVESLRSQKAGFQRKISAYDELGAKLRKLLDAVEDLSKQRTFVAHQATLSDGAESQLKATPSGRASTGTWEVAITSIAQSTFLRSGGATAGDVSLGLTGTLTLQVGSTTTNVTIDSTNDSLHGIADAIEAAGAAVNASVVFDGTDYHLELRGAETGVANAVTVTAQPTGTNPLNLTQIRAASDAVFTVDGQPFTSADNTVDDAIAGITLQLLDEQATGAAPIQLTIAEDFGGVRDQLNDFVKAYNDVVSFLATQAKPRASVEDQPAPLSGESALHSIRSKLSSIVSSQANVASTYTSLASIGIKSQTGGTLKIDEEQLADALADDLDGIVTLFTDVANGVGKRLFDEVKARARPITGVVELRKDAFEESIFLLEQRIRAAEDSLDKFEEGLVKRFAQYEQLIGSLQAQGASLGSLSPTQSK